MPAYDFGWQSYYTLAESLAMPKGTRIDCLAHFDNSEKNAYNPDPTKAVRWGEQTWEEMMIGYIDYVDDASPAAVEAESKKAADAAPTGGTLLRTFQALTKASAGSQARNPNVANGPSR